tara:strand:- start:91 stop:363 length:273 start_codon:yes stop_codon:yes gene_type:complete
MGKLKSIQKNTKRRNITKMKKKGGGGPIQGKIQDDYKGTIAIALTNIRGRRAGKKIEDRIKLAVALMDKVERLEAEAEEKSRMGEGYEQQ